MMMREKNKTEGIKSVNEDIKKTNIRRNKVKKR